jgi:hypothetical protein
VSRPQATAAASSSRTARQRQTELTSGRRIERRRAGDRSNAVRSKVASSGVPADVRLWTDMVSDAHFRTFLVIQPGSSMRKGAPAIEAAPTR